MEKYLKKRVEKYSTVSFDIFDTLIERDVNVPTDIFKRVAESYFNEQDEREAFWKDRVWSEKEARMQSHNGEATLDEIYAILCEKYGETVVEKLKQLEIIEELNACAPKRNILNVFNYAISNDKNVFLISDMYLPKEVIEQLLKKCFIAGYEKLYVSNEYGANKLTGELYRFVCEENHLSPDEWLHIGDSFKADFLGPKMLGVNRILICRKGMFKRMMAKWRLEFWK